ncbi:MAG: 50S ribosomal protein L30 [Acidobacteria bacterium]|nr:MAG: 50S ribosomal protein L30 [Acidobacteriota bacterium]PYQ19906.1 MAG: 50S ribosomal protein L30 [Acidobacteriota bacterium]
MAKGKTQARGAGRLRIRMIGSVIGCPEKQRATVRGLGLRRLHQVVEREDTPAVRGMVKKIPHLVEIVEP